MAKTTNEHYKQVLDQCKATVLHGMYEHIDDSFSQKLITIFTHCCSLTLHEKTENHKKLQTKIKQMVFDSVECDHTTLHKIIKDLITIIDELEELIRKDMSKS
jgi:hypothetical protein